MNSFLYEPDLLHIAEEQQLLDQLHALSLEPVQMYGKPTKRRIASFGLDYRAGARMLTVAPLIPAFLLPVRERAAAIAGLDPTTLEQALVTAYPAGASIGWHVDHPQFGDTVVAVSLQGRCGRSVVQRRSGKLSAHGRSTSFARTSGTATNTASSRMRIGCP